MPLSAKEAEYKTVTESIWLLGLLSDLGVFQEYIDVHYDS